MLWRKEIINKVTINKVYFYKDGENKILKCPISNICETECWRSIKTHCTLYAQSSPIKTNIKFWGEKKQYKYRITYKLYS